MQGLFHVYMEKLAYMRDPKGLYEPIEYVLAIGGKRIRPLLLLLAYNLYKEDVEAVFSQRYISVGMKIRQFSRAMP